jgi:membrane dipeptidase
VPGRPEDDPPADAPDPLYPPLGPDRARRITLEIAAILLRMAADRPDALRICRTASEIAEAEAAGALAAVLHIEGCEGVGPDLEEIEILHAAGLRSIGPVWSRDNIFGHGVPFRHGITPDTGPGLTEAGRRLVDLCNERRIILDLSHMNEAGFWDVARQSTLPLVATHSNVHAICPATRNLTARQLRAIAESGGVVGLNYAVQFLRPDGRRDSATDPDVLVRHLAALVEALGEGGVALGSDFDGALIPDAIGSAAGVGVVISAMRRAGFGETLIRRICRDNWIDLIARICG